MNKKVFAFVFLLLVGALLPSCVWAMEEYLLKHNLLEKYQQKVQEIKDDKTFADRLDVLDNSIVLTISSPLNEAYKLAYLSVLLDEFPFNNFKDNTVFEPQYAVRYDPLGSIQYLESLDNKTPAQNFQLMVLLQAYQPEKVATISYKKAAEESHNDLLEYFKAEKWQSSWREEEYLDRIGDDYQVCYADLKCLLDIIPHWRHWSEDMAVYIPCETAQKYHKVAYFDVAGGGHGAQSFMISDCELYSKYNYDADLNSFMYMLFREGMEESCGTIRFLYQARAVYNALMRQYFPDFEVEQQKRWDNFAYTQWAVLSYYNFAKYNEVLNYGIGYKKALEKLADYYTKTFGVSAKKAYNTALYVLKMPSMESWDLITPDNLNYMLLTGREWKEIEANYPDLKNYKKLLDLSIAYPDNLKEIIRLGKNEQDFDIDYPNWFGKTPLMVAAQYGYLDSVKLLLENGADINKQTFEDEDCGEYDKHLCINHGKRSALMYAAQEGQYEVVKYLLAKGADVNLQDTKGLRAYDYMLGTKLTYNPHHKPTINGGSSDYWDEGERKSAFPLEQVLELTPLLEVGE